MKSSKLPFVIAIILLPLLGYVLDNPKQQAPHNAGPYYAGAALYKPFQGWMVDIDQIDLFKSLPPEKRESYRFPSSGTHVIHYVFQMHAFIYPILLARHLFFWMGDYKALEWLQVFVHLFVTIFLMRVLQDNWQRWLFLVCYGCNPIAFHFATFNYYYFWQCVPSAMALAYLLRKDFCFGWWAIAAAAMLGLVFLIRPTTIAIALFTLVLMFFRERRAIALVSMLVCAVTVFVLREPNVKNPWHTVYIGVGAYPNPYMTGLTDKNGYALFARKFNVVTNPSFGGDHYDPSVTMTYRELCKQAYLEIARKSPFLLARNAVLNILQSYSIGYINEQLILSYMSAGVGAIVIAILAWQRLWSLIVVIGLNSLPFTLYVPPIQAYMFGGYILLSGALVRLNWRKSFAAHLKASQA